MPQHAGPNSLQFPGRACQHVRRVQARLLMCYAATHPEKMDAQKQVQWQKLAKLQAADMNTIINLEALGVPVRKRGKASGLSFGRKRKRAVRKVPPRPSWPPLPSTLPEACLHMLLCCCLTWPASPERPLRQRIRCCIPPAGCAQSCLIFR